MKHRNIEELVFRALEHLPKGSDEVLLILKAHLLVEEELGAYLSLYLDPGLFSKAKLSFYQKFILLEAAISPLKLNPECRVAIDLLNQIRNKYSHSIEPENTDNLKRDLVSNMKVFTVNLMPEVSAVFENNQAEALHHALAFLIFYIGSARRVSARSAQPSNSN